MTVEEILKMAKPTKRMIISLVEKEKVEAFSENPTWENYIHMHLFKTRYQDLMNSEVYNYCRSMVGYEPYRTEDTLTITIDEPENKIHELVSLVNEKLIQYVDNGKGGDYIGWSKETRTR